MCTAEIWVFFFFTFLSKGHFHSCRSDSLNDFLIFLFSMKTNYHSIWSRRSQGVWDLQVYVSHRVARCVALLPHSSRFASLIRSSGFHPCGVCTHVGFLPLSKNMLVLVSHPGCIRTSCPVFLGQTPNRPRPWQALTEEAWMSRTLSRIPFLAAALD